MKKLLLISPLILLALGAIASGQDIYEWTAVTGEFSDGSNWSSGFAPEASVTEQGSINNGGTATISDTPFPTNALLIGDGSVEIRSGGTLDVEEGVRLDNVTVGGQTNVGSGNNVANLLIRSGGTLNTQTFATGGNAASSATIENGGALNVSAGASLQRNMTIGSSSTFTAGSLSMGNDQSLTIQVGAGAPTPISVSGSASLNGTLNLDFSGITPNLGDTWDIIDAGSVGGDFDLITGAGSVPEGVGFVVSKVDGGSNGQLARVGLETQLILSVDRGSGAVAIENRAGAGADVNIDGYLTVSDALFDVGAWSSLNSQGDSAWRESNATDTHIGELSYSGSRVVSGGSKIELGDIYSYTPTAFQEPYPEITWEYHLADTNQTRTGMVEMGGPLNDLVLVVDPDTGDTYIQNQSSFDLTIDGYLVTSQSDSLAPSNWVSLQDAGEPWRESNAASNHIGELSYTSQMDLDGQSDAISLGKLFDPSGSQDLVFEFHLAGGETLQGLVNYGSPIDEFVGGMRICGDFDGDGDIDAADRTNLTVGWTGALQGGGGATFSQGDCDGDGDVDTADLNGLIGNWTGALAGNLTDGDDADLIYDPATGSVTIDASDTASGVVLSFVLGTDENNLRTENFVESADGSAGPFINVGTNTDNTTFQIGQTDPLSQGGGPILELGNIFPEGIGSVEDLSDYLTLAEYASALGQGGQLDLRVVPEPSGIAMMLLGIFAFAIRRKK